MRPRYHHLGDSPPRPIRCFGWGFFLVCAGWLFSGWDTPDSLSASTRKSLCFGRIEATRSSPALCPRFRSALSLFPSLPARYDQTSRPPVLCVERLVSSLLCNCQRTEKAGSGSVCLFPLTPALSLQTCDADCVASPQAVRRPPHPALRQAQGHPLPPGERERQEPLSRWERGWGEGETALWAAEQLNLHHTFQGRGGGSGRHRVGATPCGCPLPQRSRAM